MSSSLCPGVLAQQDQDPPELVAIKLGVPGVKAFVKSGGRFTGQKNGRGQTAAMLAAASSPEVIEAFHNAGGVFNDDQDVDGKTAAIYLLAIKPHPDPGAVPYELERARAVAAFVRSGGRFTEIRDKKGLTPSILAMNHPVTICEYRKGLGPDSEFRAGLGNRQELIAVVGGPAAIRTFSESGGVFTSLTDSSGKTAGEWARSKGAEVLAAYNDAVKRQGGLEYVSGDDEYSALKNAQRIESFRKAGCMFDDRPNKSGLTAEVIAILGGPKVVEAFSLNGGRFTNRINSEGLTTGDLAARYDGGGGLLDAYRAAVKRQGGLTLNGPADEYEAIRMGSSAIEEFVKHGGKFDDVPDTQDLTPGMVAASTGQAAIEAFARAGGRFTDRQNKLGYTAAMVAAYYGADAIAAFVRAGGVFTGQQDHRGNTVGMIVAMRQDDTFPDAVIELHFLGKAMHGGQLNLGRAAIDAFIAGGGKFTDQQNAHGRTAAMYAIQNGAEAVRSFAAARGHFTDQEDKAGFTSEIYAALADPDTIRAFVGSGGHFTEHLTSKGLSSEFAVARGTAEQIRAYSESGGIFTDRKSPDGLDSAKLASGAGLDEIGALPLADLDEATRALLLQRKEQITRRNLEATRAYQEALTRQGGLRHVVE